MMDSTDRISLVLLGCGRLLRSRDHPDEAKQLDGYAIDLQTQRDLLAEAVEAMPDPDWLETVAPLLDVPEDEGGTQELPRKMTRYAAKIRTFLAKVEKGGGDAE